MALLALVRDMPGRCCRGFRQEYCCKFKGKEERAAGVRIGLAAVAWRCSWCTAVAVVMAKACRAVDEQWTGMSMKSMRAAQTPAYATR